MYSDSIITPSKVMDRIISTIETSGVNLFSLHDVCNEGDSAAFRKLMSDGKIRWIGGSSDNPHCELPPTGDQATLRDAQGRVNARVSRLEERVRTQFQHILSLERSSRVFAKFEMEEFIRKTDGLINARNHDISILRAAVEGYEGIIDRPQLWAYQGSANRTSFEAIDTLKKQLPNDHWEESFLEMMHHNLESENLQGRLYQPQKQMEAQKELTYLEMELDRCRREQAELIEKIMVSLLRDKSKWNYSC